jgi:alkylation response protein AidB-like acyl-CoA dehydrogenase
MNLTLSEDQTLLIDSVDRAFAKHSTPARVRAAEARGFDADLWELAWSLGLPWIACPPELGGAEAGVFDAVLMAEVAGRHLASIPLLESIAGTRALASSGPAGLELLSHLQGEPDQPVITVALRDAAKFPKQVVPQGAVARVVVALEGGRLVAMRLPAGAGVRRNLASLPLADLDMNAGRIDRIVLAEGDEATRLAARMVSEYVLLSCAFATAAAMRAIETAAQYACEREAFGKKIGGYQGIAHPMADSAVDLEGARLLAWRAAERFDSGAEDAEALVEMTRSWASGVTGPAVTRAIRAFGGYGMSDEYDAQLYFRRACAAILQVADVADDSRITRHIGRALQTASDTGARASAGSITFDWDAQSRVHMERARAFCEARSTPEMLTFQRESLDRHDPGLFRAMASEGLLYPDWPVEHRGGGLRGIDAAAIDEVIGDFGWDPLPRMVTDMVGKMIIAFGTDAARAEILPGFARGDTYAALGYSEPSGGSDIFAARTQAIRKGDDWVINGQKMFTSQGHFADYALMVARTAPEKHKGITLFIVPLRQSGFAATEIRTIGDERTNVTFYEDVVVPDRYRLGEVNGGVQVLTQALKLEQSGGIYGATLKRLLRAAWDWATTPEASGAAPLERRDVEKALADLATRIEVQQLLTRRAAWAAASDRSRKSYGPMSKLFGSESLVATSAALMRLGGSEAMFRGGHPLGIVEHEFRRSLASTIYGGTSEVHRSVVAEDLLGLPRSR